MTPPTAEALLLDLGWLRTLSQRLVSDPAAAEDLAQDTCVAALRSAPREVSRTRAWLATIVRNFAHRSHRTRTRREALERSVARPEAVDSAEVLVTRAQMQQAVVAAVLALAEPYRSTVLLRFFEGKKPREIAALHAVAVATVDSRLQRAFTQLRDRLDAHAGTRATWIGALAPWLPFSSSKAALWAGLLGMNAKAKIVASLLLAVGLTTWWFARETGEAKPREPETTSAIPSLPEQGSGTSGAPGRLALRTPLESRPSRPATVTPAESRRHTTVRGRVLDAEGRGAAGIAIVARAADALLTPGTSEASGWFTVEVPDAMAAELVAQDEGLVTVFAGAWVPPSTIEPLVVVAPALRLAGHVRDRDGVPIGGVAIGVVPPPNLRARLGLPTDGAAQMHFVTQTDSSGAFRFARVPGLSGATIQVAAERFVPQRIPLPPTHDERIDIVLEGFRYEGGELTGKVVDPAGVAVEGARVAMGLTSVTTDARGHFTLGLKRAGYPSELLAAKPGFLPARLSPKAPETGAEPAWPREVVLVLGEAPRRIRGKVLGADGSPLTGALVSIDDPEQLGIVGSVPIQLEYWLAGGGVPLGALRPSRYQDDPVDRGNETTNVRRVGEPDATWHYVRTDRGGEFELRGLQDRSYRIRVTDPASALTVVGGPFMAGTTDARITLGDDAAHPRVEGRIVSLAGKPLAGVQVNQMTFPFQVDTRVPGGKLRARFTTPGRRTTTDVDGRFVLERVSKANCVLEFSGDAVVPRTLEGTEIDANGRCEVRLAARCHFQITLSDPTEAVRAEAFDAEGRNVEILRIERNSTSSNSDIEILDGKTDVLTLPENATSLGLFRDGELVRRVPLALVPGRVFEVR